MRFAKTLTTLNLMPPRYAARRDSNDLILAHTAMKLGARMVFAGPLDWWCGYRGKWYPVEMKSARGKYTDFQTKFLAQCEADDLPVWTWRSVDDVLKSLGAYREGV